MAVISGTNNNDTINGLLGNDFLLGYGGDDTLYGDEGNDYLLGDEGNDYLLGGSGNDILIGGFGDEPASGDSGNNILIGTGGTDGNDTLIGGGGADTFIYFYYFPNEGIDTITDFFVTDDTIEVYASSLIGGLTPGAAITPEQFILGSAAADANNRFIYNQNTGALFFDADGTGASGQVQFAQLSPGLAMTNNDIFVRD